MKLLELDLEYIGGDIVEALIADNQRRYGDPRRRFVHLDLLRDRLPRADLVLCRDCLVHLSHRHVLRALKNIRESGSTYLLTTTFVGREVNEDIPTGLWRPINLERQPFGLPTPIRQFDEECPWPGYRDKHLSLWRTDDIPVG